VDAGSAEITDFGFTWMYKAKLYQVSLFDQVGLEEFSVRISSDLDEGIVYRVMAYIQTKEFLVTGNTIEFLSQGSESPVIHDFFPRDGFDGTLVTITGKYFSQLASNHKIWIQNIPAPIIHSSVDSIVFQVPEMEYQGDAQISLAVGAKNVTASNTFYLRGPQVESISSLSGHSGEYLTITGKDFMREGSTVKVYFGTFLAELLYESEYEIHTIVPPPKDHLLEDITVPVIVKNGLKSDTCKDRYLIESSWENRQPPPFSSDFEDQVFAYDGNGYILERSSGGLYTYHHETDLWTIISFFPGKDVLHSLNIVVGDILYRLGGNTYWGPEVGFWEYHFLTGEWYQKEDIPFSFNRSTAFVLDGQAHIITDEGQSWRFDPVNGSFTRLNDFPENFRDRFAFPFLCNEEIYVVTYGKTLKYEVKNDTWIQISENPFQTQPAGNADDIGFELNGTAYVLHGEVLFKYIPQSDTWIRTSMYPGCLYDKTFKGTFVAGGKAYVVASNSWSMLCAPLLFYYKE